MRPNVQVLLLIVVAITVYVCLGNDLSDNLYKYPTVGISILVRNKAHTLPYFFTCLINLDYPKDRIYIWIHSDYNEDNSIEVIEKWVERHGILYNGVYVTKNLTYAPNDEAAIVWSPAHFRHIIQLREEALRFGRTWWADYVFMLDADVFLTDPTALKTLVSKSLTISAPMLVSDGLYSNFWAGMKDYYYERTDDYKSVLYREKTGCFEVPMVHSAVLIMLRRYNSDKLTYVPRKIPDYDGPEDDIIAFAVNANRQGVPLHVCNDIDYGFITIPVNEASVPSKDQDQFLNVKLEAISQGIPLPIHEDFQNFVVYPEKTKYGCNEIFLINLKRRKERRWFMENSLRELGMDAMFVEAVDGRNIDLDNLNQLSISLMPHYEDPYHKRPMKSGEIGCFLSHYNIWVNILEKRHAINLILEDDIHFVPFFKHRFMELLKEVEGLDWDLIYIGRKILQEDEEMVTQHTTRPRYSYWTLGYLLSERGARKLIRANPLGNLLPVDEFLPIMFNEHPNDTWKARFPVRDLVAFSAHPLLVHPTHYTGQDGYVSDTEDSPIIRPSYTYARTEL